LASCSGKTALVTDAAHGTGRTAAIALGKAGAQVLVHHSRRSARANAVVEEIRAAGGKAQAICVDLVAAKGPHDLARRARAIIGERLDVLVVNALLCKTGAIEDETVAEFDAKLAANVRAPYFLIQQLLPILSRTSSLIFTSPRAAPTPDTMPEYASAEGAIASLVAHFAPLLGPRGIRVNAIVLGAAELGSMSSAKSSERAASLVGRYRDIGSTVAFLASHEAFLINGETVRLDS